jgi:S-adenosylmethionine:tRNA ribosyltransferase-isomerase
VPPLAAQLFDYTLPEHLVAQTPAARRDQSRLLVVDRATRTLSHHTFADLPRFLRAGDTLFRNNAAVLPARLRARRPTGGQVECFLQRPSETHPGQTWRCLIKPGKKLPVGATFAEPTGAFHAEILDREPDGSAYVRFHTLGDEPVTRLANRVGEIPLPPYILRPEAPANNQTHAAAPNPDRTRYQTVYANPDRQVAVAAPTAGLHFTPELLTTLSAQGIHYADLTLHVGLGTFKPITTATIEEHAIHRELYEIPAAAQRARAPRADDARGARGRRRRDC